MEMAECRREVEGRSRLEWGDDGGVDAAGKSQKTLRGGLWAADCDDQEWLARNLTRGIERLSQPDLGGADSEREPKSVWPWEGKPARGDVWAEHLQQRRRLPASQRVGLECLGWCLGYGWGFLQRLQRLLALQPAPG